MNNKFLSTIIMVIVVLLLILFIFLYVWFDVQSDVAYHFCGFLKNCPGITIVGY